MEQANARTPNTGTIPARHGTSCNKRSAPYFEAGAATYGCRIGSKVELDFVAPI